MPGTGYAGHDSFTFTVNDGELTSTSATVAIYTPGARKRRGCAASPDGDPAALLPLVLLALGLAGMRARRRA